MKPADIDSERPSPRHGSGKKPAMTVALLLLAVGATVVWVGQSPTRRPAEPPGAAPTPARTPEGRVAQVLAAAMTPGSATEVRSLPGEAFSRPFQGVACEPLVNKTRRWVVEGDPATVVSFLVSHAPAWIPNVGTGESRSAGATYYGVLDEVQAVGWDPSTQLVFSVGALGDGETGIRADAEVVPPGAVCVRSATARTGP